MSIYDRRIIHSSKTIPADSFPLRIKDLQLGEDAVLYFDRDDYTEFTLSWSRTETDEEYEFRIKEYEERKRKLDELKMKRDRQEFERMVKEYGWTV